MRVRIRSSPMSDGSSRTPAPITPRAPTSTSWPWSSRTASRRNGRSVNVAQIHLYSRERLENFVQNLKNSNFSATFFLFFQNLNLFESASSYSINPRSRWCCPSCRKKRRCRKRTKRSLSGGRRNSSAKRFCRRGTVFFSSIFFESFVSFIVGDVWYFQV